MRDVLEPLSLDYEIIFSLDPCSDGTERASSRPPARSAHQAAEVLAPLRPAGRDPGRPALRQGDACVVIDGDLQDPPELIVEMVARWRDGFDIVYAQRVARKGETLRTRIVASSPTG